MTKMQQFKMNLFDYAVISYHFKSSGIIPIT